LFLVQSYFFRMDEQGQAANMLNQKAGR